MNIIWFSFWILFYIITTFYLFIKFRDILENPSKYRETELEYKAREKIRSKKYFPLFKSLSHQYTMVSMLLVFALTAVAGLLSYGGLMLIAQGNAILIPEKWLLGILAMFFVNINVGLAVIPLHIKTTFWSVAVCDVYNGSRYDIWKKSYLFLLISYILAVPFFILSSNHYIHYNDEGITYSAYFSLDEIYTSYEDVDEIWVSAHYNKNGQPTSLHYEIRLTDKTKLDICTNNYYNQQTLELHNRIMSNEELRVYVTPLTEDDIAYLTDKLSTEQLDIIQGIFEEVLWRRGPC